MIRITSGKYKNKKLEVPDESRPLLDRMRLSLFDLLKDFTTDANILDLYAGSGVTGIEALSRGAGTCTFIDASENACQIIHNNIKTIPVSEPVYIVNEDAFQFVIKDKHKYDLIFLDPPFNSINYLNLDLLLKNLYPEGLIIARLPAFYIKSDSTKIIKNKLDEIYRKKYGKSFLVFYRAKV